MERRRDERGDAGLATACPWCEQYVTADGRSPGGTVWGRCDRCRRYVELWAGATGLRVSASRVRYDDGVWADTRDK